jgi:hypothetical protein
MTKIRVCEVVPALQKVLLLEQTFKKVANEMRDIIESMGYHYDMNLSEFVLRKQATVSCVEYQMTIASLNVNQELWDEAESKKKIKGSLVAYGLSRDNWIKNPLIADLVLNDIFLCTLHESSSFLWSCL